MSLAFGYKIMIVIVIEHERKEYFGRAAVMKCDYICSLQILKT